MCYVHNQWYDISCATLYKSLFKFCVVTAVYHSFSMQNVRLKYFAFLVGYDAQCSASRLY